MIERIMQVLGAAPLTMLLLASLPVAPVGRAQDEATWTVLAGNRTAPGELDGPAGLAVDAQGNLLVTDSGNHRIQKLSPSWAPLAQWGGQGFGPGQFRQPPGVAVDREGNV